MESFYNSVLWLFVDGILLHAWNVYVNVIPQGLNCVKQRQGLVNTMFSLALSNFWIFISPSMIKQGSSIYGSSFYVKEFAACTVFLL